jgi:hypothetical protein
VVSGVREQPIHAEPDEASTVDLSLPRGVTTGVAGLSAAATMFAAHLKPTARNRRPSEAPELTATVEVGLALVFAAREWLEVLEHF